MTIKMLSSQIKQYEQTQNAESVTPKLFKLIFDDFAEYLCMSLATSCVHQRGKIRLQSFELLAKIIEHNIRMHNDISEWITDDDKMWKYIACLTFDKIQYVKDALASNALTWMDLLQSYKVDA